MRTITIGRGEQCDIVIPDNAAPYNTIISRNHAEISVSNGQYVYYDHSTNGSGIGGQIIRNRKIVLTPGTPVLLANQAPLPWDRVYALLPLSGYRVNEADMQTTMYGCLPAYIQDEGNQANHDKLGIGWGILAFIIPLAGWIMYFVWKDETPNRANAAGIIGTIAFVLNIIVLCI